MLNFSKLVEPPYINSVEWSKWHVFWVDERVVPKDHPDSNYLLAYDNFLSKVPYSMLFFFILWNLSILMHFSMDKLTRLNSCVFPFFSCAILFHVPIAYCNSFIQSSCRSIFKFM